MIEKGVSDTLYNLIVHLMQVDTLKDFNLGGGTNLAIRYNHRESVDIDLFSQGVVGTKNLQEITEYFESFFKPEDLQINKENFLDEKIAYLNMAVRFDDKWIKIEVIQNLPLNYPIDTIDGIRLINELDIGAMKLVSAANRGTQKDFYDLYLLSDIHGFKTLYNELLIREEKYLGKEYKNLFNPYGLPSSLSTDLSSLANFTKASNRANSNNRIKLTKDSAVKKDWITLREQWKQIVASYAQSQKLQFNPPEPKKGRENRHRKKFGL